MVPVSPRIEGDGPPPSTLAPTRWTFLAANCAAVMGLFVHQPASAAHQHRGDHSDRGHTAHHDLHDHSHPAHHDHHPADPAPAAQPSPSELAARLKQVAEDQGIYVESDTPGVRIGGYVDTSFTYGFNGPDNGPNAVTGAQGGGDFNLNEVYLALEKPLAPDPDRWSAGFAIALGFGEDAGGPLHGHHHDHSAGEGDDGTAAQIYTAYAAFRVPVGRGLDFRVGKFHALSGYESPHRPYNPHHSFGLLRTFLEPAHHTGLLAQMDLTDHSTVFFGLVNGYHADSSAFLDGSDFSKAFIGGFSLSNPQRNAYTRFSFFWAPEGDPSFSQVNTADGSDFADTDRTQRLAENDHLLMLNWFGSWRPQFAHDRLTLGFNATALFAADNLNRRAFILVPPDEPEPEPEPDPQPPPDPPGHHHHHHHASVRATDHSGHHMHGAPVPAPAPQDPESAPASDAPPQEPEFVRGTGSGENSSFAFGLGLYAEYQLSPLVHLGGRLEYLHSDDGTLGFVDGLSAGRSLDRNNVFHSQTDLVSWTLTSTLDIWENLLFRLEYRLDLLSSDDPDNLFQNGDTTQHLLSLSAAYLF